MATMRYSNIIDVVETNARYLATGVGWPEEAVERAVIIAGDRVISPELSGMDEARRIGEAVAYALNEVRPTVPPSDYVWPARTIPRAPAFWESAAAFAFMVAAGALAAFVLTALWWL